MLLNLFWWETLLVLTFSGLTFAFYAGLRKTRRSALSSSELPFVSVVVPARNEEGKIRRCLESLLRQDYPHYEIVVIDDRSTDSTGQIAKQLAAADARLKVISGSSTPAGWMGKCHAISQAVKQTSGSWIIFTDADTVHADNSLKDAVSQAIAAGADLTSFVPLQELGSTWERIVMPLLLGSFLSGDPFHAVNNPRHERAYAYGQYILVRRAAYHAVGGHRSVYDEIVEDHALAYVFKSMGYRIQVADGRNLYKVRMYTDLRTLWEGWSKNLFSLIECNLFYLIPIVIFINCVVLGPLVEFAWIVALAAQGESLPVLLQLSGLLMLQVAILLAGYKRTCTHLQGVDLRHFCYLPLGSLMVSALYLRSAYLVLSGSQVKWKGRQYKVNPCNIAETFVGCDNSLEKAWSAEPITKQ